jgi:hypothetical protein
MNGSDNNVDTLLFVIEDTCRVIVDKLIVNKKTACLGDLFFMSDGVYWIDYVSLEGFDKEASSAKKGTFFGGIVGGVVGTMLGSAQDKANMEKINMTGFDTDMVMAGIAEASRIRDEQYGFSISERLKPRSNSSVSFRKSMKKVDIQSIDFSPNGVVLTFTLAHDEPVIIYPTTISPITDIQRNAIKRYMSNKSMKHRTMQGTVFSFPPSRHPS